MVGCGIDDFARLEILTRIEILDDGRPSGQIADEIIGGYDPSRNETVASILLPAEEFIVLPPLTLFIAGYVT